MSQFKTYLKVLILLLIIANGAMAQNADILEDIRKDVSALQYEQASLKLQKLLQQDSTSIVLMNEQAKLLYLRGLNHEAKEARMEILELDSLHVPSLLALTQIFKQEQNWPKNIKYNRLLIERDPNNEVYQRMYAETLVKVNEIPFALIHATKAYELNPDNLNNAILLSRLFTAIDSVHLSGVILSRALRKNKDHVGLLKELGKLNFKQKEFSTTVEYLERAQKMVDLEPSHQKMLGFSYLKIDSVDLAIRALRQLIHRENEEYVNYYLAMAYEKKDDLDASEFHYKQAIEMASSANLKNYFSNLAVQYENKNDLRSAISTLKRGYQYIDDPSLLYNLARLSDSYYKDKKIAIRYFNKYLQHKEKKEHVAKYCEERIKYLKEYMHQSAN